MRIYYSRSAHVNDSQMLPHIEEFVKALPGKLSDHDVKLHVRGTIYSQSTMYELIRSCDLVIVGSNVDAVMDKFSINIAKGCHEEILQAFAADVPVIVFARDSCTDSVFVQSVAPEEVDVVDSSHWDDRYAEISIFPELADCIKHGFSNAVINSLEDVHSFLRRLNIDSDLMPVPELEHFMSLGTSVQAQSVSVPANAEDVPNRKLLLLLR